MPKSRRAHAKVKVRFLRFIDSPPKKLDSTGPGQPIQIHQFRASFSCAAPGPARYFFTVSSTFAVPLATVTDCVVTLPSSLQVFRV